MTYAVLIPKLSDEEQIIENSGLILLRGCVAQWHTSTLLNNDCYHITKTRGKGKMNHKELKAHFLIPPKVSIPATPFTH